MAALPGFEGVPDHWVAKRPADYFATPPPPARLMLAEFYPRLQAAGLTDEWGVEPGAGHGALVLMLAALGLKVLAVELRLVACEELQREVDARGLGDRVEVIHDDFLSWEPRPSRRPRWAFGNPPFGTAQDQLGLAFVSRARELVGPTGPMGMLLPSTFNHTQARAVWLADNEPDEIPLIERPAFIGDGGSFECSGFFWPCSGRAPDDSPCGRIIRQKWRG
jgi:predicted RNA methylase